jgi:uncharacterized protein (DUF1778 family)
MARKLTDMVRINLRFSEALRRQIKRATTVSKRSMNDEIVSRVTETFEREQLQADREDLIRRTVEAVLERGIRSGGSPPVLLNEEQRRLREQQSQNPEENDSGKVS